jgi:hypothetical protein
MTDKKPKKRTKPTKPLHEMTSDEAFDHLFHPKVTKAVKDEVAKHERSIEK